MSEETVLVRGRAVVWGGPDPRWVILTEAGEYALVGRSVPPSDAEIDEWERRYAAAGEAGWLAVMDRSEYGQGSPVFTMVTVFGNPGVTFDSAVAAWRAHKRRLA